MQYKTTTKLFREQYQYKVVLVCPGSHWFRSGELDTALTKLKSVDLKKQVLRTSTIKSQDDLDYAFKVHDVLIKMKDIDIRVESPWLTVYANDKKGIDKLVKIDENKVKYVCAPAAGVTLTQGTIIMPKMDFDYRVTLGKTTQEHSAFVEWAEGNKKIKLTKTAKKDLLRDRTWGGKHIYVTGDNNLLLAKMHLGGSIAKVERIVKN